MRTGVERISKKEFYNSGGFSNSKLYRRQVKSGGWKYYRIHN